MALPLQTALERHFGHREFRPLQREIIEAVLAGHDVLAVLPTGAGKSLCYQLPALLMPGVVVVISPLVALMRDQLRSLEQRGIDGVFTLSGQQSREENEHALEAIAKGRARLVMVAPERLRSGALQTALKQQTVSLLAVDEAHCICQWGHDFRPDYLRLRGALEELAPQAVLALTATATPALRDSIASSLQLQNPCLLAGPVDRPNLFLEVVKCPGTQRLRHVRSLLQGPGALPAVVYVGRKRDTHRVADFLTERGIPALPYHAGLTPALRARHQEAFLEGLVPVLVATVAFGMGIDKADIRSLIHFQAPASLEAYYQEAGRAGRDGLPARCTVLHDELDAQMLRHFCEQRYPEREELAELQSELRGRAPAALRDRFPLWSDNRWNLAMGSLLGSDYSRHHVSPQVASLAAAWLRIVALRKAERDRLERMLEFLGTPLCRRRLLLAYFGEAAVPPECEQCDNCTKKGGRASARPPLRIAAETTASARRTGSRP